MVDAIQNRDIRLSVEIDGALTIFPGPMNITARGSKTANPLENSCEVMISNLTKAHRDYILTTTSPFIGNQRSPKIMVVEAGRVGGNLVQLFKGAITSSQISEPPDIGLTLRFQTGAHLKGRIVARQGRNIQSLSSLSAGVAKDLGMPLTFEAADSQVANYSFSGAALRQVDALGTSAGVDAYVDDNVLVVKNTGVGLQNRVRILNKNTGLIGVPEFTERGLKVKALIDATITLGGTIQVESELNPATNGQYVVYKLDFDIATREVPFYFIAEAVRPGQIFKPKKASRAK